MLGYEVFWWAGNRPVLYWELVVPICHPVPPCQCILNVNECTHRLCSQTPCPCTFVLFLLSPGCSAGQSGHGLGSVQTAAESEQWLQHQKKTQRESTTSRRQCCVLYGAMEAVCGAARARELFVVCRELQDVIWIMPPSWNSSTSAHTVNLYLKVLCIMMALHAAAMRCSRWTNTTASCCYSQWRTR